MEGKKKKNREWIYVLIGIICILITVISIVLFLLQGSTKTVNSGEFEVTESVICEGKSTPYPIFTYDNANSKTMQINAIFNGDKLETISLTYKLDYNDNDTEQIKQSSAENHVALNRSFEKDSLDPDSFGVNFSKFDDAMQMSLYAKAKELNGVTAKYFLLDEVTNYTKDSVSKKLSSQGLDCTIKNKS